MTETGIYLIRHIASGKVYVGSAAVSLRKRKNEHYCKLRKGKHENRYLQNAWSRYGEAAFEYQVLELCPAEQCIVREQHWLDYYGCADEAKGYNILPTAGSNLGKKWGPHSQEVCDKMKEAAKKRNATEEYAEALAVGIERRNADPNYQKKLTRANKLRDLNGSVRTAKALKAMKQHKEGRI